VKHTVYTGTQTELPRREVLVEGYGGERITYFDYSDYDAKIDISLPPCQ